MCILFEICKKTPFQKCMGWGGGSHFSCSWFEVVKGQCAQMLGLFGGHLGAFLGHIVVLEGPKGLFGTEKSSCMWRVATISLRLAVLNGP